MVNPRPPSPSLNSTSSEGCSHRYNAANAATHAATAAMLPMQPMQPMLQCNQCCLTVAGSRSRRSQTIFALSIAATLVVSVDNFLGPKARARALGNGAKKLRSLLWKYRTVRAQCEVGSKLCSYTGAPERVRESVACSVWLKKVLTGPRTFPLYDCSPIPTVSLPSLLPTASSALACSPWTARSLASPSAPSSRHSTTGETS